MKTKNTPSEQHVSMLRDNYPHIAQHVIDWWGTYELQQYFNNLIFADRSNRDGFPPEVFTTLIKLSDEHSKLDTALPPEKPKNPKIYTW